MNTAPVFHPALMGGSQAMGLLFDCRGSRQCVINAIDGFVKGSLVGEGKSIARVWSKAQAAYLHLMFARTHLKNDIFKQMAKTFPHPLQIASATGAPVTTVKHLYPNTSNQHPPPALCNIGINVVHIPAISALCYVQIFDDKAYHDATSLKLGAFLQDDLSATPLKTYAAQQQGLPELLHSNQQVAGLFPDVFAASSASLSTQVSG